MGKILCENGYTDIHSHVIYGVDDGSKSLDMSIQMLKMCYDEGVRNLFATPHNYAGRNCHIEEIKERYEILKEEALKIDPNFKLYLGNEILYRKSIVEDIEKGECLTMNGTNYVLVEFVPQENYRRIYEGIWDLIKSGYKPIIAHIERVDCLHDEERNLLDLLDMGCKMQVNTETILGGFFDKMTKRVFSYINDGNIHYLGSDCHNLTSRVSNYTKAMNKIQKKMGNTTIELLTKCDIL